MDKLLRNILLSIVMYRNVSYCIATYEQQSILIIGQNVGTKLSPSLLMYQWV